MVSKTFWIRYFTAALLFICSFTFAVTRPQSPSINGTVTYNGNSVEIPIDPVSITGFKEVKYHAALIRDLTVSFERTLKEGTKSDEGAEGPVIVNEIEYTSATNKLIVNVGPGAKARYFVGICASGLPESSDSEQIRYYSPWKVYTDGSGMPLQVKTILDGSMETFYSRALVISDSEVVYMLQCGMSNASACSLSVTCGNEIRSVSMANFNGFLQATDIKAALSKAKTPGNFKNLVLNDGSRYTIFMVFNKNGASDIVLKCKRNTGGATKILADNVKASVVTDHGFKDMVQTILALGRMPDTVSNPVNYTGPLTVTDDKQEKLVVCAMLFNALAHVSPIENRNEVEQGVFSNYIQFADSVVRGWSGLTGSGDTGFIRLEKINNLILAMNKGDLADPVYVKNNGTLSDYGKSVKERKNYAFYEGYTRLDAEISYSPSGSATLSGAGVMFRVSDNIEVYAANIADTFNMFKEPFIPCTTGSRRIIIKANDSLWGKLSTDGIWVKGKDEGKGDQQYYIGISKVRLPLKVIAGAKPIGVAFKLGKEGADRGDPVGTMVGGAEKSVLKIYDIMKNKNKSIDTLKNTIAAEILMHGQNRKIVVDSNYVYNADSITFSVISHDLRDRGKLFEEEIEKRRFSTVIKDSSITFGKNDIKTTVWYKGKMSLILLKENCYSRKLWFKDVENGEINPKLTVPYYEAIFETDTSKLFPNEFYQGGKYNIKWSSGLQLHKSPQLGNKDKVFTKGAYKEIPFGRQLSYNELISNIKPLNKFYLEMRYTNSNEWIIFEYVNLLQENITKQEIIQIDLADMIINDFNQISKKVSSLCNCKTGIEYYECIKESEAITSQYIKMYSVFANHPKSFGLIDIEEMTRIPIDAQNYGDYHRGWLCFQWAFFTQYYLNLQNYKHFKIEWSAVMALDGNGDLGFAHNWISLFVPSCSDFESERIHLDPWIQYKVVAFTSYEHGLICAERDYIGKTNLPIGFFDGIIKGYYDGDRYFTIDPPRKISGEQWQRWPKWIIERY